MIASLPMYDWPELQPASDALWAGLRERLVGKGIAMPQNLTRTVDCDSNWLSPDLVFGNTCGYSLATELRDKVAYLATPTREIEGCKGTSYSSVFVTHESGKNVLKNFHGRKLAYNSKKSWSGYHTLALETGNPTGFFGAMLKSGGHRQSARLVAEKSADFASIDAICWHYLKRHEPQTAANLSVVGWSSSHPAPPFISSINSSEQLLKHLRAGLGEVLNDAGNDEIVDLLAITGCEVLDPDCYLPMAIM